MALAGAVRRRKCRRAVARQNASVPDPASRPEDRRKGGGADLGRSAGGGDPLDRSGDGRGLGISVSPMQRSWRAHGLRPHRIRQFKLSKDPDFAAKLHDIVGLYVNPPDHVIVLSVDEKSQIRALDRTQPGQPMKK